MQAAQNLSGIFTQKQKKMVASFVQVSVVLSFFDFSAQSDSITLGQLGILGVRNSFSRNGNKLFEILKKYIQITIERALI